MSDNCNSNKKRKTVFATEQQQLPVHPSAEDAVQGKAFATELLTFKPKDIDLDCEPVSKCSTPVPIASSQSSSEPRKFTPTERKLHEARSKIIHTGPTIRTLETIQKEGDELLHTVQNLYLTVERIRYLADKTIDDQLGLYKARFALEATYAESGIVTEDITAEDRNGNELVKFDVVRTLCDHDPHISCYGKIVRITGIVVLIELPETRRVIARLSKDTWLITKEVLEARHQLEEEVEANEQLNEYLANERRL